MENWFHNSILTLLAHLCLLYAFFGINKSQDFIKIRQFEEPLDVGVGIWVRVTDEEATLILLHAVKIVDQRAETVAIEKIRLAEIEDDVSAFFVYHFQFVRESLAVHPDNPSLDLDNGSFLFLSHFNIKRHQSSLELSPLVDMPFLFKNIRNNPFTFASFDV
jgi:hypothetical protein